ncbi:MAG: hypothetical protein VYC39_19820 [Myxococcota bacterium]|nr:hypothetical protein [Myxococcota bacterium]
MSQSRVLNRFAATFIAMNNEAAIFTVDWSHKPSQLESSYLLSVQTTQSFGQFDVVWLGILTRINVTLVIIK